MNEVVSFSDDLVRFLDGYRHGVALELISQSGVGREYGLIFIDWMMPEFDVSETCRRVRELLPTHDVRIVVMASAHDLVQLSARMELDPQVVDTKLSNSVSGQPITRLTRTIMGMCASVTSCAYHVTRTGARSRHVASAHHAIKERV